MSKRFFIVALLTLLMLATFAGPLNAQDATTTNANGDPVVYAVFFYSPTCPHCHDVIENHFPVLEAEFGDQLVIIPVNVSVEGAGYYFYAACEAYGVPEDRCGSVPMMVMGEGDVMIGAVDIPARMPGLVRAGLSAGGIPVPAFIREDYEAAVAAAAESGETAESGAAAPAADPASETPGGNVAGFEGGEIAASVSVMDRLAADPAGNAVAVGVLAAMIASVVAVVVLGRSGQLASSLLAKNAARAMVIAAVLAAASLLAGDGDDSAANAIAIVVVGLLSVAVYFLMLPGGRRDLRSYAVPAVILAGFAVAFYLAQVETSETAAVCGAIGDCNTVQQSIYATLLGVLPVGVLGMIGYAAMMGAWAVTLLRGGQAPYTALARAALFWMALGGTAFSIYLTFLEPFVIGASCMWCITSALTMAALLWLTAPAGWQAGATVIVEGVPSQPSPSQASRGS